MRIKDTVHVALKGYVDVDHEVTLKTVTVNHWVPEGTVYQQVLMDGKVIGEVEGFMKTEHVKVGRGRRLRRDLKPKKVWRDVLAHHRHYSLTRKEEVARIIADHLVKKDPSVVQKPAR